ncbi:MAG: zinc ABC transporter substrate-binding protein [Geminicoccaceae bacterium]
MRARRAAALLAVSSGMMMAAIPEPNAKTELRIAATVAPVHSLVAMVTEGIIEPALIVRPGASPHGYALKPSEARALDDADIVFWVGKGLESWMAKAVTSLAGDANVIELGEIDGILRLDMRESGAWNEEAHGETEEHGGHNHEHAGGYDPHFWLDPQNALIWAEAIAEELASADPSNAASYRANAKAAILAIETVAVEIDELLQPVRDKPYAVFHDAYRYFENRFGLQPIGAISLGDADRPGPAGLIEIREAIVETGAICIFAEPQFEPRLIETVIEGSDVSIGTLDPIGAGLQPGAELYSELLRRLAVSLADCLG